jgi:hypothetical protein
MCFMFNRYLYDFPFLGDDSTITVDDNRVDPMIFPPEVAPQLSFIELPWKVSVGAKLLTLQFRCSSSASLHFSQKKG